jgi:soluble cytochrome b562
MSEKEVISLEKYFAALINERDKALDQRFKDMEKAVTKAETAHEKRLEGMNEFRGQLLDQAKSFLPREQFDNLLKRVDKIENLKQGGNQAWFILVAGAGLLIAFLTLVIRFIK